LNYHVIIEARFNGPPGSGNGGYSAGLVASHLDGAGAPIVVTLRRPPPLDTPLRVAPRPDGGIAVYHDDQLIADAVPATGPPGPAVPPVSPAEARAVAKEYPGFADHPFPTCYVCGPQRREGDGLRIFPAPLADGRSAGIFRVPPDRTPATVWAALDCPGGWSIPTPPDQPARPYVLGRLAAQVLTLPGPGAECVVVGQTMLLKGRKAEVRSAVYDPDGALVARADATWIGLAR
jgi:hypothetical protein